MNPDSLKPEDDHHKAKLMVDCQNQLGECPLWDDRRGEFIWVDINGQKIHLLHVASGLMRVVSVPEKVGSFALCESGSRLLLALTTTFAYYYFDTHEYQPLKSAYKQVHADSRLNDGRADRSGRFVVGDMYMDANRPPTNPKMGNCYQVYYTKEGEVGVRAIKEVPLAWCTNSISFSPNGRTMYHADTQTWIINSYPYDQTTGVVGQPNQFHSLKDHSSGKPDGACVNSKGQIWSSHFQGGRVELYEPHLSVKPGMAGVAETVNVPVKLTTCSAIGGPNMDWMVITTKHDPVEKNSGGLYITKVATKGLPESRFNDI